MKTKGTKTRKQGYYIEHNGDNWQSVFPSDESDLSQLHETIDDAKDYFSEVKPSVSPVVLERKDFPSQENAAKQEIARAVELKAYQLLAEEEKARDRRERDLLQRIRTGESKALKLLQQREALQAQRDELLAVMEKQVKYTEQLARMVNHFSVKLGLGMKVAAEDFTEAARAAIARATE